MHLITWWQSVLLGLVQGLTEFIPVSSSAHLNILHQIFGQDRALTYDVLVSIGTTIALAWYFRRDWKGLLSDPAQRPMLGLVLLSCIPAVVAGLLLRHLEDTPLFADVRFNAVMLALAGLILWLSDVVGSKTRGMERITWVDALVIGIAQAFALIPGVSRLGSTMTAALFLGLKRETAARYSLLVALPITLGATVFELKGVVKHGLSQSAGASTGVLLLGILVAALVGSWTIDFLLKYLKTRSVAIFAIWRVVVALFILFMLPHFVTVKTTESSTAQEHSSATIKVPITMSR